MGSFFGWPLSANCFDISCRDFCRFFGKLAEGFSIQSKRAMSAKGCVTALRSILVVPVVTYPFIWIFDIDANRISEPARELSDKATSPWGNSDHSYSGLLALLRRNFFRGLLWSIRKRNS